MSAEWIKTHRFILGILADSLTFVGAAALARDAFRRLSDLRRARTDMEFRKAYASLHLNDEELEAASRSLAWTFSGFLAMCLGFLCQLALRLAE